MTDKHDPSCDQATGTGICTCGYSAQRENRHNCVAESKPEWSPGATFDCVVCYKHWVAVDYGKHGRAWKLRSATPLFYVQNAGRPVGNCVRFWEKDRCGYTCDLNKALKLPLEEARKLAACRKEDVALPANEVDRLAERHLDSQKLSEVLVLKATRPTKEDS